MATVPVAVNQAAFQVSRLRALTFGDREGFRSMPLMRSKMVQVQYHVGMGTAPTASTDDRDYMRAKGVLWPRVQELLSCSVLCVLGCLGASHGVKPGISSSLFEPRTEECLKNHKLFDKVIFGTGNMSSLRQ